MMRNVTGVVKDSLDRADAWVERLRIVGLKRSVQGGDEFLGRKLLRRILGFLCTTVIAGQSRQSSAFSVSDDTELPASPLWSGSSSTICASSIPSTPGGSFASLPLHGPVPRIAKPGSMFTAVNEVDRL